MKDVEKNLESLGLTGNEAKAYLAALELGPATAQQIAAKAAVVRPTAYVAIGGLIKRGLMSQFTKGKKQYYAAEKPDQLMRLVQDEKKKIVEREEKLKTLLPGLSSLISLAGEKPEVKFYEGLEGLEAMRRVLFDSKADTLYGIFSMSEYVDSLTDESVKSQNYNLKKANIKIRNIVINGNKKDLLKLGKYYRNNDYQYRILKADNRPFFGEISIFGSCMALIVYLDKPHGFLIESKEIAEVGKVLFESAWKGLP